MRSTLCRLLRSAAAAEVRLPRALAGVDMRPYQREGLAWLAFLRRSGLHGVLADDMVMALLLPLPPQTLLMIAQN